MTTATPNRLTTSRDIELLTALVMSPLTVSQMLKLSKTFAAGPFLSQRTLLDRLQKLRLGEWVRRWPLAIAIRGGGAPDYYKITLQGLKLLYGEEARPPTKQFFAPVAVSKHFHMKCLGDFLVHTAVAAYSEGFKMVDVHPENTFIAEVNGEKLLPDHRFDLVNKRGERYRYLIELDNSTETIYSIRHEQDTWHRKIRLHNAYRDQCTEHHRVVTITTRSKSRLTNIMHAANLYGRNPNRTLFIGTYLSEYLESQNAVTHFSFIDHRGQKVSLIPQQTTFVPAVQHSTLLAVA